MSSTGIQISTSATSGTASGTPLTSFAPVPIPSSATPTVTSGGPNNNGGGNDGGGGGNQFPSSSASNLYLYTFLATLVLLLLVSGAVIVRSVTLRVRARRAIEESIRNGTYVPPQPSLSAVNAVKPKFHDAHIKDLNSDTLVDEKVSHWDNIVPITASFVPGPTSATEALPPPATAPPSPRANDSIFNRVRTLATSPFRSVRLQDILDELASRDLHARLANQQAPQPSQSELAAAAFGTITSENGSESGIQHEGAGAARPSAVRLAVLIAMPDPTHPSNVTVGAHDDSHSDSRSTSSSSTASAKGKTPAHVSSASTEESELEMPYVEFGVAEVPLYSAAVKAPSSNLSTNDSE